MKIEIDIVDAVRSCSDEEKIEIIRQIDMNVGTIGFTMDLIKELAKELNESEGITKTELRKLI